MYRRIPQSPLPLTEQCKEWYQFKRSSDKDLIDSICFRMDQTDDIEELIQLLKTDNGDHLTINQITTLLSEMKDQFESFTPSQNDITNDDQITEKGTLDEFIH